MIKLLVSEVVILKLIDGKVAKASVIWCYIVGITFNLQNTNKNRRRRPSSKDTKLCESPSVRKNGQDIQLVVEEQRSNTGTLTTTVLFFLKGMKM